MDSRHEPKEQEAREKRKGQGRKFDTAKKEKWSNKGEKRMS
jgi:hypothetical protein